MCLVKTPKIKTTAETSADKPVPILTNPILDGLNPSIQSLRIGRSSLKIDPAATGSSLAAPAVASRATNSAAAPAPIQLPARIAGTTGGLGGRSVGNRVVNK